MVSPEVIRRRLQKLDEYLAILRGLQRYDLKTFLEDPERYGSAERFLQLAIETLIDIGNHVIAELQLGTVDHYRDVPALLAQHRYLDGTLEERWVRMISFRNILVHDYLDVDRRIVYRVLHEDLEDLEALRRVFAQFL
jgi:uncharacterized protein YutE (UPF0331/DUF86 family)